MMSFAREMRTQEIRVGLVPTSGSLHEGHLSLASRAREMCDSVIVAICPDDSNTRAPEHPTVDLARDAELAFTRAVDLIFAPALEDLIPDGFSTFVVVEGLLDKLEGVGRPGYFRRYATIINKLVNITQPRFMFLGRKEAQRVVIVKRMLRDLSIDVEMVICPTVREEDGLALSSSNANLSTEERRSAIVLRRALDRCRSLSSGGEKDTARLIASMRSVIESEPIARIDYVAITDTERLDSLDWLSADTPALVCVAAYIGETRLTDNILLNGEL